VDAAVVVVACCVVLVVVAVTGCPTSLTGVVVDPVPDGGAAGVGLVVFSLGK